MGIFSSIKQRLLKPYYEAKERRRIEREARRIEERHGFNQLVRKYRKQGFDEEEASILAQRDYYRQKSRRKINWKKYIPKELLPPFIANEPRRRAKKSKRRRSRRKRNYGRRRVRRFVW